MLPLTVAALAGKNRVAVATLYEFQFKTQTMRFWDGLRYLEAGGHTWQGAGKIISASGLEQSRNMDAPQATFTLSGATPDLVDLAVNSADEVTGRPVSVYIQFLADRYTPLDAPIAIWAGNMDVMSFRAGLRDWTITLTAETLFVNRVRTPYGFMTDRDQQARWPGDRGFEFMPSLRYKTVSWLYQ